LHNYLHPIKPLVVGSVVLLLGNLDPKNNILDTVL